MNAAEISRWGMTREVAEVWRDFVRFAVGRLMADYHEAPVPYLQSPGRVKPEVRKVYLKVAVRSGFDAVGTTRASACSGLRPRCRRLPGCGFLPVFFCGCETTDEKQSRPAISLARGRAPEPKAILLFNPDRLLRLASSRNAFR